MKSPNKHAHTEHTANILRPVDGGKTTELQHINTLLSSLSRKLNKLEYTNHNGANERASEGKKTLKYPCEIHYCDEENWHPAAHTILW